MKNNQKGFGVVEGLLIFVIVGIIGGAGWYVWNSNKKTNDSLKNADTSNSVTANLPKKEKGKQSEPDPTTNWKAYSNKEGQFSLKYPSSWATASHPDLCSPGILLLGANTSTVGRCASDGGSHMAIYSNEGDQRSNSELQSKYYPDLKTESVTVNGVNGKKQTGTYKLLQDEEGGLGPSDGDQEVQYTFYTNGNTYIAAYSIKLHGKTMPDVLSDFNLMVTKTLKFSVQ